MIKLLIVAALLLAIVERSRIATAIAPIVTLPSVRPDRIGAVR